MNILNNISPIMALSGLTIGLIVVVAVLLVAVIVLYFIGRKAEKKQAEQEKTMKAALYDAMVKFGIKKFESDVLNLTLVEPTTSTSIDAAKLKKKYPAIAAECSKSSAKAGYVKITLKGGEK